MSRHIRGLLVLGLLAAILMGEITFNRDMSAKISGMSSQQKREAEAEEPPDG